MQSVSFKIWTRVAVSISYNDNHYTTSTYGYTTWTVTKCSEKNIGEKYTEMLTAVLKKIQEAVH